MVELRFQPHAVERMQERGVSVDEIHAIVNSPDGRIPQSKDKVVYFKRLTDRKDNLVVAVVIEKMGGGLFEIVTVLVNFEVRK